MKLYDQECNRSQILKVSVEMLIFKNIKTFKFSSPLLLGIMQLT